MSVAERVAAAAASNDFSALLALAFEMGNDLAAANAKLAQLDALQRADDERKRDQRERQARHRAKDVAPAEPAEPPPTEECHVTSRDVTLGHVTGSLSPLVPPSSRPGPHPTPPYNPPSPSAIRGKTRGEKARTAKRLPPFDQLFTEAWALYPSRPGNNKAQAWEQWLKRVADGEDPVVMLTGTQRFAKYASGRQWDDRSHIPMARTFFGPNRRYLDNWTTTGSDRFEQPPIVDGWMSPELERLSRPAAV